MVRSPDSNPRSPAPKVNALPTKLSNDSLRLMFGEKLSEDSGGAAGRFALESVPFRVECSNDVFKHV